jgi:hypothetical protein
MKKAFLLFIPIACILLNFYASAQKITNPIIQIEYVDFQETEIGIKLTAKGIKEARDKNGRKFIALKIINLAKQSSKKPEIKVECLMARIFYHVNLCSVRFSKFPLNKWACTIEANYWELKANKCKAPTDLIDLIPN